MEQATIDSAQSYYNHKRRRSFLFSRIFVMASMIVLLVVLGINVFVLSSQSRTQTTTHASFDHEALQKLPSPPAKKMTEQKDIQFAVNLPILPPDCNYQATQQGYKLKCSPTPGIIPPVVVVLPSGCTPDKNATERSVTCLTPSGQTKNVPLPELPLGCFYQKATDTLTVDCQR